MKKSQILAALALAFALGVAAPVAGVLNSTASAITIEDGKPSATVAEVQATIDAIKASADYKNYEALSEAVAAVDTTGVKSDDVSKGVYDGLETVASAASFDGWNESYDTEKTPVENVNALISATESALASKSGYSYDKWAELNKVMGYTDAVPATMTPQQKADAVVAAAQDLGMVVTDYESGVTALSAVQGQVNTVTSWNTYKALIAEVVVAQDAVENADAKATALETAMKPFINEYGATAYANAVAAAKGGAVSTLAGLADSGTMADDIDAYEALADDVDEAQDKVDGTNGQTKIEDGNDAFVLMNSLRTEYKNTFGKDLPTTGVETPEGYLPDGATNGAVTVSGLFKGGVILNVEENNTKMTAENIKNQKFYDITLTNGQGGKVEFQGSVTVFIALPDEFEGENTYAYYADPAVEGLGGGTTFIRLASTYDGQVISFSTDHFSVYGLVEFEDDTEVPGEIPADKVEEGEGKGAGVDEKVGDTGAISGAEGSATVTASVMASIASISTAAGAAWTAIRRIRGKNA